MTQVQAGYTANQVRDMVNDNIWKKDKQGRGFENITNYDNAPEEIKSFLRKEDKFSTVKDGYRYNVKYWENSDSFSISRIKLDNDFRSGSQGQSTKPPFAKTIYRDVAVEFVSKDVANNLLKDRTPGGYWTFINGIEVSGEAIACMVRKEKLQ